MVNAAIWFLSFHEFPIFVDFMRFPYCWKLIMFYIIPYSLNISRVKIFVNSWLLVFL